MPGMVEAHTHLTWASSVEKIYHAFILPPDELEIAATRNARVLLDHGFTSLWSAGALGDGIEPRLAARIAAGEALPLAGVPFAIKDNIDLAGSPTTAGCPDFAYQPGQSANVVARLIAAGAVPVGKTNLDQFATGLNGTR
eukprot:gene25385-32600_t